MKRKRFPPKQLSLDECFTRIRDACNSDTLRGIRGSDPIELHDGMGRWVRNNCGLWEDGTDRVVADIVHAHITKKYFIQSLNDNKFVHPDIPFMLKNACPHGRTFSRDLSDPDNCSSVIMEIFITILKDEHDATNKNQYR
jgi:hypothetical protein